nr:unnamed protein product [Callosobruchus chinensis]
MQSSVSRANGILLSFHQAISASTKIIHLLSEKMPASMVGIGMYIVFKPWLKRSENR